MIDILHLHGFKCAGTTFASILQANYGEQVGYVESKGKGDRLPWQMVPEAIALDNLKAVSSHLVTLPPQAEGFAKMHVAFVREPRERIRSAYRFQRRTGTLEPKDITFNDFVQRLRRSTGSNYQTRHLSPQDQGGWQQRKGWQLRPELIDFDREDLFIGLVERFDESLVILEARLQAMGIDFDASYPSALNVEPKKEELLLGIPVDAFELDETLCDRVENFLTRHICQVPNFESRLSEFRDRCNTLVFDTGKLSVPGPAKWNYIDTSLFGSSMLRSQKSTAKW